MNPRAAIVNALWVGSGFFAWQKFRRALQAPAVAQERWLTAHLTRHADCALGRHYGLDRCGSYAEFSDRIPLQDYKSLEPWIERIRHGEPNVLGCEPVTRLIPTSGSTGARKLIPFTVGLQQNFNTAIAPWMSELARQTPGLLGGPAYWSISPAIRNAEEKGPVPIGFDDDAAYLGGLKGWLVRAALVAPEGVTSLRDKDEFQFATLLGLLAEDELRLISVWHPTFLTLLLDALPVHWDRLLARLSKDRPRRARQLAACSPWQPETLWPRLTVISCWGASHARAGLEKLQSLFPGVFVQPKGLLATESFVTIPWGEHHPLALRSHFFEFLDERGGVHLAHELEEGGLYEVIVTTGGGLWRYRLGDQVVINGFVDATPSLEFVGRSGVVSDCCGEKLSEAFVGRAITGVADELGVEPGFTMLAPERDGDVWRYTLFLESGMTGEWALRLDQRLRENPHYAYCQKLGQLKPLRVLKVGPAAAGIFFQTETARGRKFGEVKGAFLSTRTDWGGRFQTDGEEHGTQAIVGHYDG